MTIENTITVCDATLRDGSHACSHQLTRDQISQYAKACELAGYDYLEVGHGNGLGASSLQVGQSLLEDREMLEIARNELISTKLSVHAIPGFATIKKDIQSGLKIGVDLFRFGCHCTEADITQRHISYVREAGRIAWGVLMMSHMIASEELLEEASKMVTYGAQGIVLMDSAGAYLPCDVEEKIRKLVDNLDVPIGFHAHDNLGLSVANSLAAIKSGAKIIDGTSRGFGAGAGNTPLELVSALFSKIGVQTNINFYHALDAAELANDLFHDNLPSCNSTTIVSGLAGVFSGFVKPAKRAADAYDVDIRDILVELGHRKVVGGQEDLIFEVASSLSKK